MAHFRTGLPFRIMAISTASIFVADWHALTSDYASTDGIRANTLTW